MKNPTIFADAFNQFLYHGDQKIDPARLTKLNTAESQMSRKEEPTDGEFLSGFWKTDRLIPVVTLVIYFGSNNWDAPLSLKEMYSSTDSVILAHAPDYHVNLIPLSIFDHFCLLLHSLVHFPS